MGGSNLPAGLCGASKVKDSLLERSCHVVMPARLAKMDVLVVAPTQCEHQQSWLIKSAYVMELPVRKDCGGTAVLEISSRRRSVEQAAFRFVEKTVANELQANARAVQSLSGVPRSSFPV
jgi:hypothetical protein